MPTGYLVVAKDGKEYGPLDRETIQSWYREGKLDGNSKVYEPGQHKFRLKEIFDLALWDNPALITQSASNTEVAFQPRMMNELTGEEGREPTPGMFAAGVLLIINGVMGLLAVGLVLLGKFAEDNNPRTFIVPIIDLIVAVGLIRGKEKYRKWGLVRAVLGSVFLVLATLAATVGPPSSAFPEVSAATVTGWFSIIFQFMFCIGMAALLWGDWPSKLRVGIGVASVLIAWSGIITTTAISGFVTDYTERAKLQEYSISASKFEDDELGVSTRLPEGWALLKKDNPLVSLPDAAMIAFHRESGCFAALIVEPDVLVADSADNYLSLVLENRQKTTPSMKETGRLEVDFGGQKGRRLDTSWSTGGKAFRGFATACKAGGSYYMLSGWCLSETFAKALPAFESLSSTFEVGPRPLNGPPEIQAESESDIYDLVFFIRAHKIMPDGSQTFLASGVNQGTDVGFELLLGPQWKEGSISPGIPTYTGFASYHSAGADSDSLMNVLDELYKTKQHPKGMKSETKFSAISLDGDPRDLEKGPVELKLFFEASGRDYAELFTNIDLKSHKLYLGEKDPEYRGAIIRALKMR